MTDEQAKLAADNHNLIYSFLKKYNLPVEEYYDLAAIGLCKAAEHFDSKIAKFSTLAYSCMRRIILQEFRNNRRKKCIPGAMICSYNALLDAEGSGDTASFQNYLPSPVNVEHESLAKVMLDEYMHKLNDKQRLILMYCANGYTQMETAEIVGCSQAHVSRTCNQLRQYIST